MPTRYTNYESRREVERSVASMEKTKNDPVSFRQVSMKDKFLQNLKKERDHLASITPPDTDGSTKDAIRLRTKKLADAWVNGKQGLVPPYPNQRQMEKVTVGAPGQHLEHERFWKSHNVDKGGNIYKVKEDQGQQGLAFELKDNLRVLRKDEEIDNPDIANLEQFRPSGDNQVALADHPLPRSYGLSLEAKAKYDEAFPDHEPTPVEQKLAEPEAAKPEKPDYPQEMRCQAKNKKNGSQCKAEALKDKETGKYRKYCMIRAHRNQFVEF